jgi:uncharacterized protein (DUF1810 family)
MNAPAANDPFDLQRFVDAQEPVYAAVVAELRAARKTSHWMWFVFPQITGLGSSAVAQHYSIKSLAEAQSYPRHPVLGPRLAECVRLMLAIDGRAAAQILGGVDAMKFRSSMTLFERAAAEDPIFAQALEKYYDGRRDDATLAILDQLDQGSPP